MKDLFFCGSSDSEKWLAFFEKDYFFFSVASKDAGYTLFFERLSDFLRFQSLMGLKRYNRSDIYVF